MTKNLIRFTILLFVFMGLVACNTNNEANPDGLTPAQNNNADNYYPNNVSFNGSNPEGNNAQEGQGRDEIPINPGREQNIFQQPNNEGNMRLDENQGVREAPSDYNGNGTNQNEGLTEVQSKVVVLTNQHRQNNGLSPLQSDQELTKAAQAKSDDMATNSYFSHTSPTYGSPFDMLKQFGIDYTRASENIASGQQSPDEVVEGWMNSPGHRKNILDPNVTHIGVGYSTNGDYWTQLFIKK